MFLILFNPIFKILFVASTTLNKSAFKSTFFNSSLSNSPTISLTLSIPNTKANPAVAPSLIIFDSNNSLTNVSKISSLFNLSKLIFPKSNSGALKLESGTKLKISTALIKILPI